MNKTMKNMLIFLVSAVFMTALLCGCGPKKVSGQSIEHEEEFGGVYIHLTIDDFNALGYVYGDSVDINFSNGYKLENIPYYNGYYTNNGEPLLVAYPGYPYIKVCINNGDDLWMIAGLSESATAKISLAKKSAFREIQNARDIHYQDDREQFPSDEAFANFRSVRVTGIAEGMLCRSASPCDNQHNRAPYVDALIEKAGVNCILNLADTDEKIQGYIAKDDFNSPYFLSLYDSGKVIPLGLNMNFSSDDFHAKVANGLRTMIQSDGPYLVHCTEGKDRTGFVCLLLEALCGAGYDEIVDDYMITYDNYYKITPEEDAVRYNVIVEYVLNPMIQCVVGDENNDLKTADLASCAEKFLLDAGMKSEEIDT
ncbi:MAG: tyrosine-protein phosphatase, partial [Lachnospiraceae bacterium]|nr:tyrosine-protein phosphatase [Lachnospiraceae bacterium]